MRIRVGATCLFLLFAYAGPASAEPSLNIRANKSEISYGGKVKLRGSVTPTGTAEKLVVQQWRAGGIWRPLQAVSTNAKTGVWLLTASPKQSMRFRVQTGDGAVTSDPVTVRVSPVLKLRVTGTARPFLGAPVSVRVTPSSYSGRVILRSRTAAGEAVKRVSVHRGRAHGVAPVNAVGRIRITGQTRATNQFASASTKKRVRVRGRTLRRGSKGRDVSALMKRLRKLGFLIPGKGRRYTFAMSEVAMAFHKAYGMRRSYVWGQRSWKRISRLSHGPRPRYGGKNTHVEVYKGRQVMMIVRNGKPISIIHVSTGRTGNTPIGNFRIISLLPNYLPYFEGFLGNFGLHGYHTVPPYPASHGCVREPIWAARFTWRHTGIGTPVHIYR